MSWNDILHDFKLVGLPINEFYRKPKDNPGGIESETDGASSIDLEEYKIPPPVPSPP